MKHHSAWLRVACVVAGGIASLGAATGQSQDPARHLDADGNGLYDDAERKALLSLLQKEFPETDGAFDANGDNRVSIEEQSAGRHPLSMTLLWRSRTDTPKVPWAIDVFPEWLSTAYLQEDIPEGAVAEHPTRGTRPRPASQASSPLQPRKVGARGGVEFAENSGQHLTMPGERYAHWNYRWCLFTFRIDGNSGSDQETVLLDLNQGKASLRSSPKIWYDKDKGLHIQYVGLNKGGLDQRVMSAPGVVADGKTWNVVVCGIRYGQMFASVNGVPLGTGRPQPPRFSCALPPSEMTSYLGDGGGGNMAWAYDALVFGLTEPSEAMVRKMTGWAAHRLGFENNLPGDHPYRAERPVLDAEDFPQRFVPDNERRLAWGASLKKELTRSNAGGPRVEPRGFERVFYDDFRAYRVAPSTSGEGDLWVGPGFNTAVGIDAPMLAPGQKPDVYPYDAEKHQQAVSVFQQGDRSRSGALYTINDMGHGYTWKGPKIFRIRSMFPKPAQGAPVGGLFSGFWSYDPEFLFWRTANRVEVDWLEFDGKSPSYLNSLSTHLHYVHLKSIFAQNTESYRRFKVYGGELTQEKSGIPGGIVLWDGQFRTWEFVVTEEMTYANVTITDQAGQERWVEVYRCPTEPSYLARLDLQVNLALKAGSGAPKDGEREDYIVDWIEVLQKSDQVEIVPQPFTARPHLTGAAAVGSQMICEPHIEDITDLRYYWFADGYPLTWGPDNAYRITADEAGKEIRCMVKAVGALDMPEAWSNALK